MKNKYHEIKHLAQKLLAYADIQINGSRPWDIQVHNEDFYARVLRAGSLGFGESYMDGWWDSKKLDECVDHILRAELDKKVSGDWKSMLQIAGQILLNPQTKTKSRVVGKQHYDLGNDLYVAMLDPLMAYSCGYWKGAQTLEEAQIAKLDLICKKLQLKPGQKVLDIGCGWGGFAKYAAQNYGVYVTGVTISKEQAQLARKICEGLDVKIELKDYRDVQGEFDRIVSIGMFEHVGYKNYRTFMEVANRLLKKDGILLLHTIGQNTTTKTTDPWITKYIFPNSMLPSIKQIAKASENIFVMEDWHNFGVYYDKTLLAWQQNFENAWPQLNKKYSERFRRMWNFYLLASAATFRCRNNQLWQIVFTKKGLREGYESVR